VDEAKPEGESRPRRYTAACSIIGHRAVSDNFRRGEVRSGRRSSPAKMRPLRSYITPDRQSRPGLTQARGGNKGLRTSRQSDHRAHPLPVSGCWATVASAMWNNAACPRRLGPAEVFGARATIHPYARGGGRRKREATDYP